jgi:L-lactate utilization protein LutB
VAAWNGTAPVSRPSIWPRSSRARTGTRRNEYRRSDLDRRGGPEFSTNAKSAVNDSQLRRNVRKATSTISERRAGLVAETPDWQELRAAGAAIKDETLHDLDTYLEQFERNATNHGAHVHWARDATEANQLVTDLIKRTGHSKVIKVKSMVTQEIGVVEALRTSGVTAYQTDFAELIIQLAHNRPRDWAPGTQLHSLRGLPQRVPGHERTGGHAYGATYPGPSARSSPRSWPGSLSKQRQRP